MKQRKQNVYSVAQVNSYIKNMFTQDFMLNFIAVKGEVSNCKYHSSGHIYFTLKDKAGTIACVMFAKDSLGLAFQMQDGQQIIVSGSVSVYERDGKYQLYAKNVTLDGAGLLYEKFQLLKSELEEMGMFAQEYKREIPTFIRTLGVVTASTGAAVQDIISIAKRRNPYIQIIIYPAIVQGDHAAASIVSGIHALEAQKVDTIIVGRGGGSMEDLWAFNELVVAEAIFECEIPIISAVGHETDISIADFVADLRAPTPSAAAELAVYELDSVLSQIELYESSLKKAMLTLVEAKKSQLALYQMKIQYGSPNNQIMEKRMYSIKLEEQLQQLIQRKIEHKKHKFALFLEQLKGLSPLDKLQQGYSYASDSQGKTLTNINQVDIGDRIQVHIKNGYVKATVIVKKSVRRNSNE